MVSMQTPVNVSATDYIELKLLFVHVLLIMLLIYMICFQSVRHFDFNLQPAWMHEGENTLQFA